MNESKVDRTAVGLAVSFIGIGATLLAVAVGRFLVLLVKFVAEKDIWLGVGMAGMIAMLIGVAILWVFIPPSPTTVGDFIREVERHRESEERKQKETDNA